MAHYPLSGRQLKRTVQAYIDGLLSHPSQLPRSDIALSMLGVQRLISIIVVDTCYGVVPRWSENWCLPVLDKSGTDGCAVLLIPFRG